MAYEATIRNLFYILHQANLADTDSAKDWQKPGDASGRDGVYHHISKAIEILAGKEVLEHCCDTGEPDMSLCDRHVTEHQSLTLQDIKGLEWVDYEGEDLDACLARRLMGGSGDGSMKEYTVLYAIVGQIGGLDYEGEDPKVIDPTWYGMQYAGNGSMTEYTVLYSLVGQIGGLDYVFRCRAEDTVHAINQTINSVLGEDEVIDSISQVDWEGAEEVADESNSN